MIIKLDLTKSYGLVLEGGGAKGAYQIGAWKALAEAGVKIRGISGVSVGALNGALICMNELQKAEAVWENISYSNVIDLEEVFVRQVRRVVKDFGLDISPLKRLIKEMIDEQAIRDSERELFITTFSVSDRELLTVDLKTVEEGQIEDFLLASAYFLAFKNEKLNGKRYLDGGGFDNVPIRVLLDRDYQDIIVIRIYGLGVDSERKLKIPEGVTVHHIAPRIRLGGMLEFDAKRARKNMKLGYFDAKRLLYGLEGRVYYIDAPENEGHYLNKLIVQMERIETYVTEGQVPAERSYRYYTETLFPLLAKKYHLKAHWDYKMLYLSVLEGLAKKVKMNRYQIYTETELCDCIMEKLNLLDSLDGL